MRAAAVLLVLLLLGCDGDGVDDDGRRGDDSGDRGDDDGEDDGGGDSSGPAACGELPDECFMVCPNVSLEYCVFEPYPPPPVCSEVCATGSCCDCALTDSGGREWRRTFVDCARPTCPNNIASDEDCFDCVKDWGSGASYCADGCTSDEQCIYSTNPWADEGLSLVCHPDGYCTRPCETDADCFLTVGDEYICDPSGACSFCIDCT
jgi:hypothetical protein